MVVMFVDCCVGGGRYFLYYSYCRNPMGQEFLFPLEPLSVKLLTAQNVEINLHQHIKQTSFVVRNHMHEARCIVT
jgi:hypothetical protein